MREHFAKWASPAPGAVTIVTNLSPEAISQKPCIDAVSPLSPMSPRKNGDPKNNEPARPAARIAADSMKKHGDNGDSGDKAKSLDNFCHQNFRELVTLVTTWPAEARQEVEERAARLMAGGWTPDQARVLAACIVADQRGLPLPGVENGALH